MRKIPDEKQFKIYTAMTKCFFLKRHVGQQWYPNQYYGSHPTIL